MGAAGEQQHLWRACMEELNRRLRHEVAVQMVRDKHGSTGATALAAMLAASRHHETKVPLYSPLCGPLLLGSPHALTCLPHWRSGEKA